MFGRCYRLQGTMRQRCLCRLLLSLWCQSVVGAAVCGQRLKLHPHPATARPAAQPVHLLTILKDACKGRPVLQIALAEPIARRPPNSLDRSVYTTNSQDVLYTTKNAVCTMTTLCAQGRGGQHEGFRTARLYSRLHTESHTASEFENRIGIPYSNLRYCAVAWEPCQA